MFALRFLANEDLFKCISYYQTEGGESAECGGGVRKVKFQDKSVKIHFENLLQTLKWVKYLFN